MDGGALPAWPKTDNAGSFPIDAGRCVTGRTAAQQRLCGGANGGNNLPTIGSPLSALTTVFGGALPRRQHGVLAAEAAQEHLRSGPLRSARHQGLIGPDRARQDGPAPRIRPATRKQAHAVGHHHPAGDVREAGRPGRRRLADAHERARHPGGECLSPGHHRQRLRVRHHPGGGASVQQRRQADGQSPGCPTTTNTAASSTAERGTTTRLAEFEKYLAEQFVALVPRRHPLPGIAA